MSKCIQCKVEVLDETQVCPLCRCVVEQNDNVKNTYPNVRLYTRKWNFVLRLILFISIIAEVICVYANYKFFDGIYWSVITGAGFFYLYSMLRFGIFNDKAGYRATILSLTFLGILFLILIDYIIGYRGWSVNYVLPSGVLFLDFAIVVLMLCNRRNWQSYIMLEILTIVLSAVSVVLALLKVIITRPFLSEFVLVVSVLLFVGTIILGDRRSRMELRRRFHVN